MSIETKVKCDYTGYCTSDGGSMEDAIKGRFWEISETPAELRESMGEYTIKIRRLDGQHDPWLQAKHSCQHHLSSVIETIVADFSDSIVVAKKSAR